MISVLQTSSTELDRHLPRLTDGTLAGIGQAAGPEDHAAAAAKRHAADRRRALAARAALRLVAAQHQGSSLQTAAELEIHRQCQQCGARQHGRPRLTGVSLSSSSSAQRVLTGAAAQGQHLGMDVEAVPDRILTGFDQYALHPHERSTMCLGGTVSANRRRVERWTLKEAVLKAAGVGLAHPPDQLLLGAPAVSTLWLSGDDQTVLHWRPVDKTADAGVEGLWCCLIPAPAGYAAAVAVRVPESIIDVGAIWTLSSTSGCIGAAR